jgi:hypothetical protein
VDVTDHDLLAELRRAKAEGATHYYIGKPWEYGLFLCGNLARELKDKCWFATEIRAGNFKYDRPIDTVIAEVQARIAAAQIPFDKRGGAERGG